MLDKIIGSAIDLAREIRTASGNTLVIQQFKEHALSLETNVLGRMLREQKLFKRSVTSALANVTETRKKADSLDVETATIQTALQNIVAEIQEVVGIERKRIKRWNQGLREHRQHFAQDSQDLNQESGQLSQAHQVLQAKQASLRKDAQALRKRIDTINGVSVVLPIVKLGSELESLITKNKTTEERLADKSQEIARLNKKITQLQFSQKSLETLLPLVSQINDGIQGVLNTLSLISGRLSNEQLFSKSFNRSVALFFLAAMETSLNQLLQEIQ